MVSISARGIAAKHERNSERLGIKLAEGTWIEHISVIGGLFFDGWTLNLIAALFVTPTPRLQTSTTHLRRRGLLPGINTVKGQLAGRGSTFHYDSQGDLRKL